MTLVHLKRFSQGATCTLGHLSVDGFSCVTIERPWLNNLESVSCIPVGVYPMKLGRYHRGNQGRGYPAYELLDVPDRTLIKIHSANRAAQVRGCIAPGESVAPIDGDVAVTNSRNTLTDFMAAMADQPDAVMWITEE